MLDIAILTEKACLTPNPLIRHNAMAIEEDLILVNAFQKAGYNCERRAWDDDSVDWTNIRVALIKSIWNYFDKIDDFRNWLELLPENCILINDKSIIKWNLDKKYLWALEEMGIRIPPSFHIAKGSTFDHADWHAKFNKMGFVIKPTISGGAKDTFYVKSLADSSQNKYIQAAISSQDMMIQPFITSILSQGELSLVYIDGKLSHSRRKRPKQDDYRVQPYYGGLLDKYEPTDEILAFAQSVINACTEINTLPIYARVDICLDDSGLPMLMELEVIEPQLWFPQEPLAVQQLVKCIGKKFLF